jgi:hypothetical protein
MVHCLVSVSFPSSRLVKMVKLCIVVWLSADSSNSKPLSITCPTLDGCSWYCFRMSIIMCAGNPMSRRVIHSRRSCAIYELPSCSLWNRNRLNALAFSVYSLGSTILFLVLLPWRKPGCLSDNRNSIFFSCMPWATLVPILKESF